MNYTSIEQSKKLMELGLSPETADMIYSHKTVFYNRMEHRLYVDEDDNWHLHQRSEIAFMDTGNEISAWSLSALLEVMPKHIFSEDRIKNYTPVLHMGEKNVVWYQHMNEFLHIEHADTSIEAAYSMVVWLLENNYIKKEGNT